MGLFNDSKSGINLFPTSNDEKTFYIKSSKTTVRLDTNFIRIARGGAINTILQGLDGEKSILLREITAYQLKEPGLTVGYLQINYPGSQDTKGGVTDAIKDENTISFIKTEKEDILQLKIAIETAIINKH